MDEGSDVLNELMNQTYPLKLGINYSINFIKLDKFINF